MLERRAMEAERETVDRYVAAFLADQVGQIVRCRITGVQPFGFFATVEALGGDGLVLAATSAPNISATTRKRGRWSATKAARPIASGNDWSSGSPRPIRYPAGCASSFPRAVTADHRARAAIGSAPARASRHRVEAAGQYPASRAETLGNHSYIGALEQPASRGAPMPSYKIAILVGSLREGSINKKIARSMCALRGDNLECSMVGIGDLPLYNQDLDANSPSRGCAFASGSRLRTASCSARPNTIAVSRAS
jgi:hypothetical protein